jgi:mannose-6-phosphate isomerase-like protein (cupin superfamily)
MVVMIKRYKEMEKEVREKMRNGKGEVEILHIFKKEELKGKVRLFARIKLASGCSIGYHTHENEEEIFYIIKGQGLAWVDDKEEEVFTGDAILTKSGSGHTIENKSDEPLEILAVILLYV